MTTIQIENLQDWLDHAIKGIVVHPTITETTIVRVLLMLQKEKILILEKELITQQEYQAKLQTSYDVRKEDQKRKDKL